MSRLKDVLAIVLVGALCIYAVWQKLEILAIISMIILVGIIYRTRTRQVIDLAVTLLTNTRQARFGDLELQVNKKLEDFSQLAVQRAVWVQILVSQLSSEHLGLLFNVYKAGRYKAGEVVNFDVIKDKLRDLRARGLLHHNAPTMHESTEVWLTDLGTELARALLDSQVDVEINPKEKSVKNVEQ